MSTEIEIKEKVKMFVIILFSFCLVLTDFDTAKGNPFSTYFPDLFIFPFLQEKKLQEAVQTIDSQRKSILDLQVNTLIYI